MMDWAPADERFVDIPGIVEIRWVSDDPDYYHEPIDLFDEQKNGLPDYYGKKDKQTTEQAWFTCNVCECDLKSVVTLRAHCKGTQHVRKALQKKKEYRSKLKKEGKAGDGGASSQKFKTLFEWLEATSEAVVGLKYITEYQSSRSSDSPMYHCSICDDIQGDAEVMKNHILSLKHRQSFLEKEAGSYLVHQVEIQQAVAEYTQDYVRDYREMQEVKDDNIWREISNGTFRPRRKRSRSPERERRDYRDDDRRTKRERSWSPKRPKPERRDFYHHDDREWIGGREDRDRDQDRYDERDDRRDRDRVRYDDRERQYWDDRHRDSYSSRRNEKRDRDRGRHGDSHSSPSVSNPSGSDTSREKSRSLENQNSHHRVKSEYCDDDEIAEVSRSGNFENWSTARIKTSRDDQDDRSNGHQGSGVTERVSSLEDDIWRLHRRVARHVTENMKRYYEDSEDFDPRLHKIRDEEDFARIAKMLSHDLRARIKESYEAYNNGSLEGISLTGDHVVFIETEVQRHFEPLPVIKTGSKRW